MVIFDPAPAFELPESSFRFMDVITPNELETEVLVGFYPQTQADAVWAAKMLREEGGWYCNN
jgi:ribokinase